MKSEKKKMKRVVIGGAVCGAAIVVCAVVAFLLADSGAIAVNPFKLMFAVLTLGAGVALGVYGVIVKGGYEFAVASILLVIGIVLVLAGLVKWYVVVVVAVAAALVLFMALIALKAEFMHVERTDEKEGYKSYMQLKEEEKARENASAEKQDDKESD